MKKILGRWTVPLVILLIAAAIIVPRTLRGRQTAELNIFNWTEYMPQRDPGCFRQRVSGQD